MRRPGWQGYLKTAWRHSGEQEAEQNGAGGSADEQTKDTSIITRAISVWSQSGRNNVGRSSGETRIIYLQDEELMRDR